MAQRQVSLDTETTGLSIQDGHRVIEIGCVEILDRTVGRSYQQFLNPEREVDAAAIQIHGRDNNFLQDKPLFKDCVEDFLAFIEGAELLMHNAAFDAGFINRELQLAGRKEKISDCCPAVVDTLQLAKSLHPRMQNSLEALCRRYRVDDNERTYHGALLDAQLLAEVYLKMTGGQAQLGLREERDKRAATAIRREPGALSLPVLRVSKEEQQAHIAYLQKLKAAAADGRCLWLEQGEESSSS